MSDEHFDDTLGICRILGVSDELAKAGFTQELGGEWRWGSRGTVVRVDFRDVVPAPLLEGAYAYQVERMKFDQLLLDNARRTGVDVTRTAQRTRTDSWKMAGSWGQNTPTTGDGKESPAHGM